MVYSLLHLVWILGIPDVVEVGPIALAALGKLIGEIVLHKLLLADIRVQMLDSDFIK